MHGMLT